MTHDDLRRLHADVMAPVNSARCPTPEQLRDAAERRGSESERLLTMDHIAGCPACRPEFDLMRAVAMGERQEARARFRRNTLTALAAGIVLVFGASLIWRAVQPEPVRGPADQVRLLAPEEGWSGATPPRFVWSSLGEGTVYVFELVDSTRLARFSATTRDTLATLPDSVSLAPGAEYRWWVRALRTDGQEVTSQLRGLRATAR